MKKKTGWISEKTYVSKRGVRYTAKESVNGCVGCGFKYRSRNCCTASCIPPSRIDGKLVIFKRQKKAVK